MRENISSCRLETGIGEALLAFCGNGRGETEKGRRSSFAGAIGV
jgi:hypothetical protein